MQIGQEGGKGKRNEKEPEGKWGTGPANFSCIFLRVFRFFLVLLLLQPVLFVQVAISSVLQ